MTLDVQECLYNSEFLIESEARIVGIANLCLDWHVLKNFINTSHLCPGKPITTLGQFLNTVFLVQCLFCFIIQQKLYVYGLSMYMGLLNEAMYEIRSKHIFHAHIRALLRPLRSTFRSIYLILDRFPVVRQTVLEKNNALHGIQNTYCGCCVLLWVRACNVLAQASIFFLILLIRLPHPRP